MYVHVFLQHWRPNKFIIIIIIIINKMQWIIFEVDLFNWITNGLKVHI